MDGELAENPDEYHWYDPGTSNATHPVCVPCVEDVNLSQTTDRDTNLNPKPSQNEFVLGMDLVYKDGKGNNKAVVYEGASAD